MARPTTALSELTPAGTDQINAGDNRIREYKVQNREVLEYDHVYPSSGTSATAGFHKKVSLVEIADIGTGAEGLPILGAQTVSGAPELVYTTEADVDIQITNTTGLNAPALTGVYPAADVAALATMMNLIYPVGHIYISYVSTNPGTLLGIGTWVAFAAGRVLVGLDGANAAFDTVGETGGVETVTLTAAQSGLPAHSHTAGIDDSDGNPGSVFDGAEGPATGSATTDAVSAANAAEAHTNLQPYITVYMWRRSA